MANVVLKVAPEALTLLAREALRDCQHLLRPGPSGAAARHPRRPGGVGERPVRRARPAEERQHRRRRRAADVPGHRHRDRHGQEGPAVWTGGDDEAALSPGRLRRPTPRPTCATARWRRCRCSRRSTPATTCRRRSTSTPSRGDAYKFLFVAKGGGSANKSFLYQQTPAVLNPKRAAASSSTTKIRTLGTAACPPYHLAIVIGGTSAEMNLKTVKLASTPLSRRPADRGQRIRPGLSATARWSRRCSS